MAVVVGVLVFVGAGVLDAVTVFVGDAVGVVVFVGTSAVTVVVGCGIIALQETVNKPRSIMAVIDADLLT